MRTRTLPEYPFGPPVHADLHWLRVPDDRNAILIEQVRELVDELALTSYAGRGKAAVIDPADAMTRNAANSLLKTLEEPPGNALLILLVDRPGLLPATIVSRCQRLDFKAPPEPAGLAWSGAVPARNRMGGRAARDGRGTARGARRRGSAGRCCCAPAGPGAGRQRRRLARRCGGKLVQARAGIRAGVAGARTPVRTAAATAGPGTSLGGTLESVLRRMDSRKLFCYRDHINRLRAQASGSFNVQLALEGLLIDWATGLRGGGGDMQLPGMHRTRSAPERPGRGTTGDEMSKP